MAPDDTPAPNTAIDLTDSGIYRHWTPVSIRFSDQDSLGHVNNVAFAAYVEAGRSGFIQSLLHPERHPDIDFVLASVTIDYKAELHWPGTVDVGTCVRRIGTTSAIIACGIFMDGTAYATAESVSVFFDMSVRRPAPVPDDIRPILAGHMPA